MLANVARLSRRPGRAARARGGRRHGLDDLRRRSGRSRQLQPVAVQERRAACCRRRSRAFPTPSSPVCWSNRPKVRRWRRLGQLTPAALERDQGAQDVRSQVAGRRAGRTCGCWPAGTIRRPRRPSSRRSWATVACCCGPRPPIAAGAIGRPTPATCWPSARPPRGRPQHCQAHQFTAGQTLRADLPASHDITLPAIEVPEGKEPKPLVFDQDQSEQANRADDADAPNKTPRGAQAELRRHPPGRALQDDLARRDQRSDRASRSPSIPIGARATWHASLGRLQAVCGARSSRK